MSRLTEWANRFRYLLRARSFEDSFDEEIRFHLESRAAELEGSGLAPRDALAQARREFGSRARAGEDSRAAWQFRWLREFAGDLRYACRAFRRSPAFTLTAVLSLSLGMGGANAVYTALEAVLWKPLPVADPQRLVCFSVARDQGEPRSGLPAAFAGRLRESGLFAGLTIDAADGLSFTYDGRAERIVGDVVSPGYFELLGVQPILGQAFTADVRSGHWAPEAVLSYNFWRQRFAGDPAVIGRTIRLNTYPFTIVGVSPPSFFGLSRGTNYELRIPILPEGREVAQIQEISGRPERWLGVVARLNPGVTLAHAQAAADAQFQEFLRGTPLEQFRNAGLRHLQVSPGARGFDEYTLPFRAPLYVLLVLVAILLLMACANVANMLLARVASRAREFAIRISIGAGRFRLIRQMLAESLLLALLGGVLGLGVADGAAGLLFHFLPQGHIPIAIDLHTDRRALLVTFAISLLAGLFFGLAPALQFSRGQAAEALKNDTAASTGQAGGARVRRILVVLQVAFSLVLLVAAGVFVRTLSELRPVGYRGSPDRILLFTMKPQQELYSDDRKRQLAEELVRRVSALPGVQRAALAENGPLGSRQDSTGVKAPGRGSLRAGFDLVTPGFFDAAGIPRIAGRDFESRDRTSSPLVAIVNQALVRELFPNRNPIGSTLTLPVEGQQRICRIVGVVADMRYYDLHRAPEPFVWLSMLQLAPYMPTLDVRTNTSDTAAMIAAVRHELDQLDRGFPVFNIRTMEARFEDSLAGERMVAGLSGGFGLLALALAAVGLYGLLAYSLARRTREIGIRMVLGARSGSLLWLVAREALLLVGIGSTFGLALAIAGTRILSQYFSGVSSADPAILAFCSLAMFGIAAAALAAPAIRAFRIDPLVALHHE